jgi:hypothetical protein
MSEPRDRADRADPRLANDPIENADSAEPADPIERTEPTEPMDRIEPCDPIERIEFSERIDHRDEDRCEEDAIPASYGRGVRLPGACAYRGWSSSAVR